MPFELNTNTNYQVLIQRDLTYSRPVSVSLAPAQPAAFLSNGRAIAVDNGVFVTPSSAATAGDVLVVYGTGLGLVDQTVVDGAASPSAPVAHTKNQLTATLGGVAAQIQFAGLAPGFVGLYQVNLTVPQGVTGPGCRFLIMSSRTGPPAPLSIR